MRGRAAAAWVSRVACAAGAMGVSVAWAFAQPADAPSGPVEPSADVAELEGVRIERVLGGLERPWGMAWLPSGWLDERLGEGGGGDQSGADDGGGWGADMLITERGGALRLVRGGELVDEPIAGAPEVLAHGQGGLMDVSLHPAFAENGFVYLTYSIGTRNENRTAMGRGRFDGERLTEFEELFRVSQLKQGGQHFGSRILWLEDGTMLLSIGDGGNPPVRLEGAFIREQAQELDSHLGKVLRLNEDGSVPSDNPFVGVDGATPEVWSYGHRNIQGMALDPASGRVYANEHGARGGDELNLIEAGENYGWPVATYSREYFGPRISPDTEREGMVDPLVVWTPAQAPCGLAFYDGELHDSWRGDLFSGGLIAEQVRYLDLDGEGRVVDEKKITVGKRVRDVRVGPDGGLYLLTDEADGELLRVVAE